MGIFTVHMVGKDNNLEYIRMYRFAENRVVSVERCKHILIRGRGRGKKKRTIPRRRHLALKRRRM
jgi:hypothetical protein